MLLMCGPTVTAADCCHLQTAPGPNLGASLMASLGGGAGSGGLPQHTPPLSDPAIVSHSLGGSGGLVTLGGGQQEAAQPSPVVMPPSAQQVSCIGGSRQITHQ
jgi:hypothetical protein